MKTYYFKKSFTEIQRDSLTLSLRKAGYSAYAETDSVSTNASRVEIALIWGSSCWERGIQSKNSKN